MNLRVRKNWILIVAIALFAVIDLHAEETVAGGGSPWLGVYLVDEVDGGIRIVAVVPGGPAANAGLRSGDLLIEAEDRQLVDQRVLERVLAAIPTAQPLQFGVLRRGEPLTIEVRPSVVKAMTPVIGSTFRSAHGLSMGLKSVSMTGELREHYGAARDRGVLVVRVDRGSVADRVGVLVGDVLAGMGAVTITDPAAVDGEYGRWDRRDTLPVLILRDRKSVVLDLVVEEPVVPGATRPDEVAQRVVRVRQLERSIALLERQIETLRRQLAELNRTRGAPVPEPANQDH